MRKSLLEPLTFVENLKRLGLISRAVFAVYLGKYLELPVLSFGTWDLQRYSTSPDFTYLQADISAGLWAFTVANAAFGNITLQSASSPAAIDSSEKKLVVPKAVYDPIRKAICDNVECFGDNHSVGFTCSNLPNSLRPNLTFTLNSLPVTISPDFYLGIRIRKKSLDKCILQLDWREAQETWLLGFPLMRSNYLLFDVETGVVGVAAARQEDDIPQWVFWLLALGVLVVLGTLVLMLLFCLGYENCKICGGQQAAATEESLLH